jgi:outer membrane protein OmpA-like peptidoglycan-associated protein
MRIISNRPGALALIAMLTVPVSASVAAQERPVDPTIIVNAPQMAAGPEVKGIITARHEDKMKVTAADGTSTVIAINDATKIKTSGGLFGGSKRGKLTPAALLNGLPVTVKTWQSETGLLASQVSFKSTDLKTANMIRQGTEQGFADQTAATEALRGRMADIDKYNIKGTTNVYFATGKWALSPESKTELCSTATTAEATNNALMLVVGYTDSVGSEEYNQTLSEKRASSVINYLQQACRWAPYRMLTPTGMAESDPLASNDTEEGKAQNRRVSVNVLVSKGLDGM